MTVVVALFAQMVGYVHPAVELLVHSVMLQVISAVDMTAMMLVLSAVETCPLTPVKLTVETCSVIMMLAQSAVELYPVTSVQVAVERCLMMSTVELCLMVLIVTKAAAAVEIISATTKIH